MNASLRKSITDVVLHKGRTLLLVVSIFLGVFSLTSLGLAKDTLLSAFAFTVENQSTQPDILMAVNVLDNGLVPQLEAIPNVRTLQYETDLYTLWHVARVPGYVSIKIMSFPDLQHIPLTPFELVEGHYPSNGEILMEYGDQRLQALQVGGPVTIETPQGLVTLRVSGLVRTPGANPAISEKAQGYMTQAGLRLLSAFPNSNAPNHSTRQDLIAFKVRDAGQLQSTAQALAAFLGAHHIQVFATGFPASSRFPTRKVEGAFALLDILVLLAVAICGLLVFSTVTTLLAEQTAIIGTMKALGATQSVVRKGYLVTVGIYSLLATLPGLFLGALGGYLIAALIASTIPLALGPLSLTPATLILGLTAGVLVPMAAGGLAVWNGTHLTVRQALAAYGVSPTGDKLAPLRLTELHPTRFSQLTWMGLRSLTRRPARAAWILTALTLAGVSFLAVQTLATSINATIRSVYTRIAAQVEVDGGEQTSYTQIRKQLNGYPNVKRVERYGLMGANTLWGRLVVWGFEPDTRIYQVQLVRGRWFQAGETDVALISASFAQKSGLRVGSTLEATSPVNGRAASWRIIGTVQQPLDSMGLVGAVVLPVNTLYAFQGAAPEHVADAAYRMLIQVKDPSPTAIGALTNQIGDLARTSLVTGSTDKEGEITNVFLLQNEARRQQLNWAITFGLLAGVAVIVGFAAALGLANEQASAVLERKREIGMLRALGATTRQIAHIFQVEGLALGALAGGLGGLFGLPLSAAFVQFFSLEVMPVSWSITPLAFAGMFAAIFAIVLLASLWITRSIARTRPAELLRYE